MDRKKFLSLGAYGTAGSALFSQKKSAETDQPQEKRWQNGASPWPLCLDTATIRPASLEEKVQIAHQAGFDAIEPWDGELSEYEQEGGNLEELGNRIKETGLFVPSVIGLWNALPEDNEEFEASLESTRNRMRMAKAIGSEHIQTIPNTVNENFDIKTVANRYHRIIEIGLHEFGIKPALVFVKFFPLKTLGQAMAVALDADHPHAMVIPDSFHMYISEGGFNGLKIMDGDAMAIFQFADAPASPSPDKLTDQQRVFPGDGILPLTQVLKDLYDTGFRKCVSLELYNPEYHSRDLLSVAKEGHEKMLNVIKAAQV